MNVRQVVKSSDFGYFVGEERFQMERTRMFNGL
jgi:hypothetical protein